MGGPKVRPLAERFWAKVVKTDDCWMWTGTRQHWGHGMVSVLENPSNAPGRRSVLRRAHRVSWEMAHGPIPAGMFVCHRCDMPSCVRPDHLFLGTHKDNMHDSIAKGRSGLRMFVDGEKHPNARLTWQKVDSIRAAYASGTSSAELARIHGVNWSTVKRVLTGDTWTKRPEVAA